ncbi:PAS domain S-box protein, partial [Escherichia coli]|uniref:PAS domain S-box protein n=1 Tax=Escherichia coli TaxID=562 RepID=UPI003CE4F995
EAQLKASESQFRVLAEVIPQIVWITNATGKTKYLNQRFYETTGLNREEDNGYLWLKAIHEDDKETFLETARACRALES